jgi:hypothetical protein
MDAGSARRARKLGSGGSPMSNIRRECNSNFTIVSNAIFNDARISIEAKGGLGWLLSRPPDWQVRHGHLRKEWRIGKDKFRRIMQELIVAGYIERDDEQPRDGDNQFSTYNYVVRDLPLTAGALPLVGFPHRASRRREPANGNKKDSLNTDSNNTPSKVSPEPSGIHAPQEVDEKRLTEFGLAARDHGLTFVFENSKPYRSWLEFRGANGIPLADVMITGGECRRGVWMPSLFPPAGRRYDEAAS